LGFVRFGWRDYDTYTGRWTAPDPLGDAGGDPDWYGYCLDDPVNGVTRWDWKADFGEE
jgi:RHS repeat-associated protein